MKPAISVGGRTGTAHNPTAYEWGTSRRGLPGLWSGTPRLKPWEDVSSVVSFEETESVSSAGVLISVLYPRGT